MGQIAILKPLVAQTFTISDFLPNWHRGLQGICILPVLPLYSTHIQEVAVHQSHTALSSCAGCNICALM